MRQGRIVLDLGSGIWLEGKEKEYPPNRLSIASKKETETPPRPSHPSFANWFVRENH